MKTGGPSWRGGHRNARWSGNSQRFGTGCSRIVTRSARPPPLAATDRSVSGDRRTLRGHYGLDTMSRWTGMILLRAVRYALTFSWPPLAGAQGTAEPRMRKVRTLRGLLATASRRRVSYGTTPWYLMRLTSDRSRPQDPAPQCPRQEPQSRHDGGLRPKNAHAGPRTSANWKRRESSVVASFRGGANWEKKKRRDEEEKGKPFAAVNVALCVHNTAIQRS